MKKLSFALALVMVLGTLLAGFAMVASAEDAATPTKQTFDFNYVHFATGAWLDSGWDLANSEYPADPTEIDPADAVPFTAADFYLVGWHDQARFQVPVLSFAETTEVTEIVLAAILANGTTEGWRNPGIEVYAWNETAEAWDEVALTSADLDTTDEYKPETGWKCYGSYRLIFAEAVAAKTFMIYWSTPNQLLGTVDGEKILLGDNFTYAKGTVVPATETTAPETNAPETNAPETNAPATEAPATSGEGAPDTADFAIASVALAAVAAAGVVLCSKKRK